MQFLILPVISHILAFFEWIFRKFAVKNVVLSAQIASVTTLFLSFISYSIALLSFSLDMLSSVHSFVSSMPTSFDVPYLFWQVLSASGVSHAIQDAFNIYYPSLVGLVVFMISSHLHSLYKLVSDELFKLGVITMI